jgi:transposase
VLHAVEGRSHRQIAAMLHCSLSTVARTLKRFAECGEAGLVDRREENGQPKVNETYVDILIAVVAHRPQDCGNYRRTTWTLELLVKCLKKFTGIEISTTTMGRLLKSLRIRRGRPRPIVECPWPKARRTRRIRAIRRLIETLPPDEVAVWEDEMDVDLNPKIGPDYMLPGLQKLVLTPGKNVKRYVAGALDAQTDRITYVVGDKKRSGLFIALLKKLLKTYAAARRIHVILDNYIIHSSRQTRAFVDSLEGRVVLHFLPPYCPNDNRIERSVWREVHANITRNHCCETIAELVREVCRELAARNRRSGRRSAAA